MKKNPLIHTHTATTRRRRRVTQLIRRISLTRAVNQRSVVIHKPAGHFNPTALTLALSSLQVRYTARRNVIRHSRARHDSLNYTHVRRDSAREELCHIDPIHGGSPRDPFELSLEQPNPDDAKRAHQKFSPSLSLFVFIQRGEKIQAVFEKSKLRTIQILSPFAQVQTVRNMSCAPLVCTRFARERERERSGVRRTRASSQTQRGGLRAFRD